MPKCMILISVQFKFFQLVFASFPFPFWILGLLAVGYRLFLPGALLLPAGISCILGSNFSRKCLGLEG